MEEQTFHMGISDMPASDRPRERLARLGDAGLSDAELLAILLRVGVEGANAVELAYHLIDKFGGLSGLHDARFEDLCEVRGVGRAKAAQIKAAIALGYRMSLEPNQPSPVFSKPSDVYERMGHTLSIKDQEELWVLALSTRNKLLREALLYIGTVNHSTVRLAEIYEIPLRVHAASIILVHNHPSGDPSPSEEDLLFTEELVKAGRLMDIGVLDHIIIAREGFRSIRQDGRVPFNTPQPRLWHG